MWLFRKKPEQDEAQQAEVVDGDQADEMEKETAKPATPDEKSPISPGTKTKNRKSPRKKNKSGAKGGDKDESAENYGGESVHQNGAKQADNAQTPDAAKKVAQPHAAGAHTAEEVAELKRQLSELNEQYNASLDQLRAAETAQEGLKTALDVSSQQLQATQQSLQSMQRQEGAVQSADRELCTAMKEQIYHIARKFGEQSYDWKTCCTSIERAAEERAHVSVMSEKVFATAKALGETSNDLNQSFAAIEQAAASHKLCAAMKERIFTAAILLGESSTDWEQCMARITNAVDASSGTRTEAGALVDKIQIAAGMLGLESTDADAFFQQVPQLKAEREVWASAKERMLSTASRMGAGAADWVQALHAMERACREQVATAAATDSLRQRIASVAQAVTKPDGHETDAWLASAEAGLAAIEEAGKELQALREGAKAAGAERGVLQEAMERIFRAGRAQGEAAAAGGGDWRGCLESLERAAGSQAELALLQERVIALARGAGEQSSEWRACVAAVEREGEAQRGVRERLARLARRLGEESLECGECLGAVEQWCERAQQELSAGGEAQGQGDAQGSGGRGGGGGEGGGVNELKELHLLLLSMQAQGWEFSSFFKTAVPEELRRGELYRLLHALLSEHQDRARIATKRALYHFSDEEDLSEDVGSDAWLSPPPDQPPHHPLPHHHPPQAIPEHAPAPSDPLLPGADSAPGSLLYQSMAQIPPVAPPHASQAPAPSAALYQSMAQVPVSPQQPPVSTAGPPPSEGSGALAGALPQAPPPYPPDLHPSTPLAAPSSAPVQAPQSAPPWLGLQGAPAATPPPAPGGRRGSLEQFVSSLMEPDRPLTFYYGAPEEGASEERRRQILRPQHPADHSGAGAEGQGLPARELQYGSLDWHPGAAGGGEEGAGEGSRVRFSSPAQTPPSSGGVPEWSTEAVLARADGAQLQAALWSELGLRLKAGGEGGVRVAEKALGSVGLAVREVRAGDNLVGVNGWACAGQELEAVARVVLAKRVEGLVLGLRGRKGGTYQVVVPPPVTYSQT